jgi:predicted amidophosphoribosyltransferase
VLADVLAVLAPPACLACRAPLDDPGVLCGACRGRLPWLRDPCPRCALPRPCAPCPARGAPFAAAWAPVAHAGPARELVLALKLGGALPAAAAMAAQIAVRLPPALARGATLVPVPALPARRRRRGFDPAARLAHEIAERTGGQIADCLRREALGGRQVGMGRKARADRARLRVRAHGDVPSKALLVDDVHTTGATLAACAAALRAAGTHEVGAVTYARTLTRP